MEARASTTKGLGTAQHNTTTTPTTLSDLQTFWEKQPV